MSATQVLEQVDKLPFEEQREGVYLVDDRPIAQHKRAAIGHVRERTPGPKKNQEHADGGQIAEATFAEVREE